MSRYTRALIHLNAIRENFKQLQATTQSKAIAVIKADAYGHGSVTVAQALNDLCECFAVAIFDEVQVLRNAGVQQPILILEGPHEAAECKQAYEQNSILLVHNEQQLTWLNALAETERPQIWLKVDTGMHRLGFGYEDISQLVKRYPGLLKNTVLASHFACADEPDNGFNLTQLKRFNEVSQALDLPTCIANTAAVVTMPDSNGNWCRLGIGLYGGSPVSNHAAFEYHLQPAMTLESQIIALHDVAEGESVGYGRSWVANRKSIIATVGIGYADGYPRHCKTGTPVIIRGQRACIVGRVSMDMITVDVTDIADVSTQDTVELWGAQLAVDEVAQWAGTISYELLTRVSSRVPRVAALAAAEEN